MMLRAGLVGAGSMGRHHARVLKSLDGVELAGVFDPAGDPYGVAGPYLTCSLTELIARNLDYAVVAAPTAFHKGIALWLAEAGVHTLVEKPLSYDVSTAKTMTEAFASAGLIGAVGHIERYNPALQAARARVEAGALGAVYQVATRRQGPFPARISDVGVIMDLASHDIDSTSWVTQRPYVGISARTAHKSGREYEDLVAATGELEGGIVANHLVNWLSPLKERLTVITGELGALVADTLTSDLTFYRNGSVPVVRDMVAQFRGVTEGDVIRYAIAKPEPLRTEHEAFRDAVLAFRRTGCVDQPGIVAMEEGLATVRVAEAMTESASREFVDLRA